MNYKALALILSASSLFYFFRKKKKVQPTRDSKFKTPYVENELIVLFKELEGKSEAQCKKLQEKVFSDLRQAGGKQKAACGSCEGLLSLWTFDDPEAVLDSVGQRQPAGSVSTVQAGNGDIICFLQLNFKTGLPKEKRSTYKKLKLDFPEKKEGPVIAVLDTGIDTNVIPPEYLWNYDGANGTDPCFDQHKYGHDFVTSNGSVEDDSPGKHGTLINGYILEQFKKANTYPRLMNIKVLDKEGQGTYYNFICGVLFAKSHGAEIINASLGYYDYDHGNTSTIDLDYLLNTVLKKKGILFVCAAGNQTDDAPFLNTNPNGNPRNLLEHPFNFASVNNTDEKSPTNILAVTTVDVNGAMPNTTQNYSSKHVDIGVQADKIENVELGFNLPFHEINPEGHVIGSSYATAIVTGRVGATVMGIIPASRDYKYDIIAPIRDNSDLVHPTPGLQNYVYLGSYIKR